MSSIRFVYTAPDGATHILMGAERESFFREIKMPETGVVVREIIPEADYRAMVMGAIPAGATNITEVGPEWEAPRDRTFRDAWKFDGRDITVDMTKARAMVRRAGKSDAEVAAATTPEDLKAVLHSNGKK